MIKKSFAMTGYITTPLFKTLKLSKEKSGKKFKKFKFDAEKYIYSNIEKPWWAKDFKDKEF